MGELCAASAASKVLAPKHRGARPVLLGLVRRDRSHNLETRDAALPHFDLGI
jgi:hypothetical protein